MIEIDSAQLTVAELLKELAPAQHRKKTMDLVLMLIFASGGVMVAAFLMLKWFPRGTLPRTIYFLSVLSLYVLIGGTLVKDILAGRAVFANPGGMLAPKIDEQLASERKLVKMLVSRPALLLRETGEYIEFEVSILERRLSDLRLAAIGIPALGILVHLTSSDVSWGPEFYLLLVSLFLGAVGGAVLLSRALEPVRRASYVLRRACEQGRTFELSADPLIRASSLPE